MISEGKDSVQFEIKNRSCVCFSGNAIYCSRLVLSIEHGVDGGLCQYFRAFHDVHVMHIAIGGDLETQLYIAGNAAVFGEAGKPDSR